MQRIISTVKEVIKSLWAAATLFCIVYIGAVAFLTAVVVDKVLILLNSRYTVEMLVEKIDTRVQQFIAGYKQWISQFDFDPSKINIFK